MKQAIKWLDKHFECLLLVIILALMTIFMSFQVFSRKILGISITWTEPLCCHLMIYMGLIGVSCTLAEGNAIRFDVIVNFIGAKAKLVFALIADIVTAATFLYLTPFTFQVIEEMKTKTIAGLPYTMSFVYTICALSVVVIDLRSIEQLIKTVIQLKNYKEVQVTESEVTQV